MLFIFVGKFGQKTAFRHSELLSSPEKYFSRVNDSSKQCVDFRLINDDIIGIDWQYKEDYEEDSCVTSEIHAAHVTAYGR